MLKQWARGVLDQFGYELKRKTADLAADELDMVERTRGLTATSPGRIVGLMDAVKYLHNNRIAGDIVECGVWRGGSIMTAAWTLLALGDASRNLYLFDTFEGMSAPTAHDRLMDGTPAGDILQSLERSEEAGNYWCVAGLEMVKRNVLSTGYPPERIHFVKGKVEDTVPAQAPERVALLRLDTDWYESTRHELVHLYPRLVEKGVLIVDDYGAWQGARQAVDEYFAEPAFAPLFGRLDYTGRLAIKPSE